MTPKHGFRGITTQSKIEPDKMRQLEHQFISLHNPTKTIGFRGSYIHDEDLTKLT
jgi:hypothetical protein